MQYALGMYMAFEIGEGLGYIITLYTITSLNSACLGCTNKMTGVTRTQSVTVNQKKTLKICCRT